MNEISVSYRFHGSGGASQQQQQQQQQQQLPLECGRKFEIQMTRNTARRLLGK
jgi:hypothetical protein